MLLLTLVGAGSWYPVRRPPRRRESILHQEGNKASNTCGPTLNFGEGGGFCVCGRHPNPTLEMRPGYKLMRHFFRPLRWATTNRLGHACRVHCAHRSARPRLSSPLCTCVVCIYIYTDVHVRVRVDSIFKAYPNNPHNHWSQAASRGREWLAECSPELDQRHPA